MIQLSIRQILALTFVLAMLIPWWWRAIEIPWVPRYGQLQIPYRALMIETIDESPEKNTTTFKVTCRTDIRLQDGILNMPQAFYPILTGLSCGIVIGWVGKGVFTGRDTSKGEESKH